MSDQVPIRVFEHDAGWFDALIDWPARLADEEPFYRRLFSAVGVRRVLDTACGSGRHAEMFHRWGLEVGGADVSSAMIDYCRRRYGDPERLRWTVRSFEQSSDPPGAFDAAVCVGNSLSLAADLDAVRRAVAAMHASLRPGGVCVIQVLNLWQFEEGPIRWQKCKRLRRDQDDCIYLKGVHRIGGRGYVDLVELVLKPDGVASRSESRRLLGLEAGFLRDAAVAAGASEVRILGNFQEQPYEPRTSADIMLVFRRK